MAQDQITVFIPVDQYREEYLRQAIDSVFDRPVRTGGC